MATPFILITIHRVQDGQLGALEELGQAFVASIEANEPTRSGTSSTSTTRVRSSRMC